MAKPLTSEQLEAIAQANQDIDKLTRLQIFTLATSGLIDVEDGEFVLTGKALRAVKRTERQDSLNESVPVVSEAALQVLTSAEALCTHRQIWEVAGRDRFERDQVLDALRVLRDEGILETVKLSGNNFQMFWRRGPLAPAVEAPQDLGLEVQESIESETGDLEVTESESDLTASLHTLFVD